MEWNAEQVKSVSQRAGLAIAGAAVAFGLVDQHTAEAIGQQAAGVLDAGITLVGTASALVGLLAGWWKHTHAAAIAAGAKAIDATGDVQTAVPVLNALANAGAAISTGVMPVTPQPAPRPTIGA